MTWEIEKGVEVPAVGLKTTGKYPWHEMKPGDSVQFTPDEFKVARIAAYQYSKRAGQEFTCRKNEKGGRVWRVE